MFVVAFDDPRIRLINSQLSRLGLSARWVAERIDVSNVSVSKWLAGQAKPRDANVFNDILGLIRDYERTIGRTQLVEIERVGLREILVYPGITAGVMNSVEADPVKITVKDWGTTRERWGRTIDGFSMSPELEPGDLVIFEDRPWEPYHIVHAFDNGEDTVKVVRGHGDKVELVPINPDYPTLSGVGVNIKGVAVMRIRRGPREEVFTAEYPHGMRYRVND